MALVARHHRKVEPRRGRGAMRPLGEARLRRVSYLAAILRIADALDCTHARLVRSVRCSISPRTVEMRVDADGDPELELWAARRKGDLFEELCGAQAALRRRPGPRSGAAPRPP